MARTYGKNAVKLLIKKFGYAPKDIQTFLDGASQDGFGACKKVSLNDYDKEKLHGVVRIVNQGISSEVKKNYGLQKESYDIYLCGIIAGGSDLAFKRHLITKEVKCIAKGDDECISDTVELDKPYISAIIKIEMIILCR